MRYASQAMISSVGIGRVVTSPMNGRRNVRADGQSGKAAQQRPKRVGVEVAERCDPVLRRSTASAPRRATSPRRTAPPRATSPPARGAKPYTKKKPNGRYSRMLAMKSPRPGRSPMLAMNVATGPMPRAGIAEVEWIERAVKDDRRHDDGGDPKLAIVAARRASGLAADYHARSGAVILPPVIGCGTPVVPGKLIGRPARVRPRGTRSTAPPAHRRPSRPPPPDRPARPARRAARP